MMKPFRGRLNHSSSGGVEVGRISVIEGKEMDVRRRYPKYREVVFARGEQPTEPDDLIGLMALDLLAWYLESKLDICLVVCDGGIDLICEDQQGALAPGGKRVTIRVLAYLKCPAGTPTYLSADWTRMEKEILGHNLVKENDAEPYVALVGVSEDGQHFRCLLLPISKAKMHGEVFSLDKVEQEESQHLLFAMSYKEFLGSKGGPHRDS